MKTFEELNKLSIDEVKHEFDKIAKSTNVGLQFYRDEIAHRENAKNNDKMLSMTKTMKNLTIAISIMTFINFLVVIYQIFR